MSKDPRCKRGPVEAWMDEHVTSMEKLNVIFNTDPIPLLSGVASNATVALDDAITELDGLTIGEYAARIAGSGIIATPLPVPQTNVRDEFALAEHHLYGSAHLGIQYYDPTVTTGIKNVADYLQPTNPALNSFDLNVQKSWYNYAYGDVITAGQKLPWNNWNQADGLGSYRLLGMRQYALSDHLGNVLATVLDRRLGHPSGSGNKYDYWQADIASAQDYYPFGMLMPGRVVQGDKFRFGFNGQEKVNEIAGVGNHNTALFWEYDTRLGRRWNLDPRPTVSISSYVAFANNPILNIDVFGDTTYRFNKSDDGKYIGMYDLDQAGHRGSYGSMKTIGKGKNQREVWDGKYFNFADPANDTKQIRDGVINRLVFVSDAEIKGMLSAQGAFDYGDKNSYLTFYSNSTGGESFDYSYSVIRDKYQEQGASATPQDPSTPSSVLFLPEGDNTAHNHMNFGNYLWGASGYTLGFSVPTLQGFAHGNSLSPLNRRRNGYSPQFDSSDDQNSIKKGAFHSLQFKYRAVLELRHKSQLQQQGKQ